MSVHVTETHLKQAAQFVATCHAAGDLAPVDLNRFWEDNARAHAEIWNYSCPQVPIGLGMGSQCLFAELGLEEDWYAQVHDPQYRAIHARRYNDLAQSIVGKRLLDETVPDPALVWPEIKGLHDIFEAKNRWEGMSYWLTRSAGTPDELEALLDRVEHRIDNLRAFMLPDNWDREKARILGAGGSVSLYRGQRGPVTFAMSVYGVENLIFLIMDRPDLATRFSDLILKAMLTRMRALDEEAGYSEGDAPGGFHWSDDNCAMLNAEMYEQFAYPILKGVFDRYCPGPSDLRGQHSDSDMAHLLPVLSRLGLRRVNFGPNLTVSEIRDHMPDAVICGQLAPFTFSRNQEVNIVAEFLRDLEMVGDTRGLVFTTAGSINNGSRLNSLRLVMAAIQELGRY